MAQVGRVTSSNKGHSLDKMLAVGYVRTTHAWPGSRLAVIVNAAGGRPRCRQCRSSTRIMPACAGESVG